MTRWIAICAALVIAGCALVVGRPAPGTQVVAVGDSILAWNRDDGQDVPTLVGARTGLQTFNGAISGAEFVGRFEIPGQMPEGDWDWVIMDGGGNDLSGNCGTREAAEPVLDRLIDDQTLAGAYAAFIENIRSGGAQVVILGYAPISVAGGPFAPCEAALTNLRARQIALAEALPGVFFADSWRVITPEDLAAYDDDLIHPSPEGGARMAGVIAGIIASNP